MAEKKTTKVLTKRKKFQEVEIPLIKTKIELIASSPEQLKDRTIKLDLTRQLRGKGTEVIVQIKIENEKAVAYPKKIRLMPYFIKRMIRKRISYVEDSFETPSQESMLKIKPFLITRKRVSKAVRKTLRNKCKNWIEDYIKEKKNNEIFNEILSNRLQKPLSLMLKKTYPLSLCEIRVLEIVRPLKKEETPKPSGKKTKPKAEESIIDQMAEIEQEKIKQAQEEIKKTQEKAEKIEEKIEKEEREEKPVTSQESRDEKSSLSGKSDTDTKETKKTTKSKKK